MGELPEVAAARRARSTGGKTFKYDVGQLGRLGIGLVAGVVNSSGERYGAGAADTTVPEVEAWAEALAAVNALKPSYLGTVVERFLYLPVPTQLRSESSSAPKTLGERSYLRAPTTSAISLGEGIGTCGVRAVSVAAPSAAGTGELELKAFQPLRLLPRLTKASARMCPRV